MKKKWMRAGVCLGLLLSALSGIALAAGGVSTPEYTTAREDCTVTYEKTADKYTASCAGLPEGRYALLVVRTENRVPETGAVDYTISDHTIAYIGQTTAVGGVVSFTFPVARKTDCVVILGGPMMAEPKIMGSLIASGATVSGTLTSYASGASAKLELYAAGTTDAAAYQTTLTSASAAGERKQSFALYGVEHGTYDLKVSKPGHTSYWLKGITVAGDTALAQNITLHCGDVNGDGRVNVDGLVTLTGADNYNQRVATAADPLCDLNGDGFINISDLLILTDPKNYNKGSVTEIYATP